MLQTQQQSDTSVCRKTGLIIGEKPTSVTPSSTPHRVETTTRPYSTRTQSIKHARLFGATVWVVAMVILYPE